MRGQRVTWELLLLAALSLLSRPGQAADASKSPAKEATLVEEAPSAKEALSVKATPDAGVKPAAAPQPPMAPSIPKERMPSLSLSVKPKDVSIGEMVEWRLTIKRKKDVKVHLAGGASFGTLEARAKDKKETPLDGDRVEETLWVSLIGFEAGDVVIPSQKLTAVDADGNLAELTTPEGHVTVKSLIANEPEPKLKEDAGPGEKVFEKDYLLLWILGGIGAALLVVLLTLLGRKLWAMRRPKPAPPPPPPRPAEVIAFEKLEALKQSTLLDEGQIKEFHVRLSETIREYLGNRYRFDSLELSSEELILALRKVNISKAEYDMVLDFLGETDLVKFAKMLPTVMESKDLLTASFRFVEKTTPSPVISGEAKKKEADHA